MKNWDSHFVNLLLEADNYRDFIRLFFHRDQGIKKPKSLTFGEFAQRSGFASKAYLNDILAGRKRITPGAIDKVVAGLKLGGTWEKYIKCLVAAEEPKFYLAGKDQNYYQARRLKIKKQILRGRSVRAISEHYRQAQHEFLRLDFPEVYASLGDLESGETFEGILRKSRLSPNALTTTLPELEAIGLIRYEHSTRRYIPLSAGIEAYGLKQSILFKNSFYRSIDKMKQRFDGQESSDQSLFMSQSFSVSEAHLATLKKQLAEVIESFAAQAEDSQGDCVAEICIGFTHNIE